MTPFFGKSCFLTWVKKWVLLTVFLKGVFFWKHYFYSVFSKTQLFKNKNCMMKKAENLWKIVGCFWTWKIVFLVFFFWGFILIVVCFCVSTIKVLKCLFSPVFCFFFGLASSSLFGFGRFVCFSVFCFWSSFWCWFGFFFGFVLFCAWMLLFLSLFFWFVFFFCFLIFFGGFKGQVRWPFGPPHLALNPPYLFCLFLLFGCCFFFVFCFLFLFLFLFFLEGLRVRWGGPSGHLTWP